MMIFFDASKLFLAVIFSVPLLAYFGLVKKIPLGKLLLIGVFYFYLVGVASKTFFPIPVDISTQYGSIGNVWNNINILPIVGLTTITWKMCLQNIILFTPFGFLIPVIWERSLGRTILIGFVLSFAIEITQLAINTVTGTAFRFADINDLIFNVVGAIFGYGIWVAFVRFFRGTT